LRGKAVGFLQFFLYLTQAFVFLIIGFLYSFVATWLPFILLAFASLPLLLIVMFRISDPKTKEI
jgi:hypothetical protein